MRLSVTQVMLGCAALLVVGVLAGLWLGGRSTAPGDADTLRFGAAGEAARAAVAGSADHGGSGSAAGRNSGSAQRPGSHRGGRAGSDAAPGGRGGAGTGALGGAGAERGDGAGAGKRIGGGEKSASVLASRARHGSGDKKNQRAGLAGISVAREAEEDAAPEDKKDALTTGWVRGQVATAAGVPLSGVRVRNVGVAVAEVAVDATTGDDGRFVLGGLPLPPATVRLLAEGKYAVSSPVACQAATDVAAAPFVTLTLNAAGGLAVTVVDIAAKPVSGARVFVKDAAEQRLIAQGVTDESGLFSSASVPAGSAVVLAEKSGFVPPGYGSGTQSRKTATIVADQDTAIELILARTAALSGWVIDAAGQPVAGAGVFLRMFSLSGLRSSSYNSASVRTGAQGEFTLNELPDGRVELCAVLEMQGISAWTPVPAADASGQRQLTLQFLASGTLLGRVVNDRFRVLPDAVVTWRPASAAYDSVPAWRLLRVPNDGTFTVVGIPVLDATLEATVEGKYTGRAAVSPADLDSGRPVTVTVNAPGALSLTGTVVNVQGAPLSGAVVRLHGLYGSSTQTVAARGDGSFNLPLTGDGPYRVSAAVPGYAPRLFGFTKDQTATDQFLVLDAGSTVAFDITTDVPVASLPAGTAVQLSLTLLAVPGTPFAVSQRAVLQASTVLVVGNLYPGVYRCEVTAPAMSARSMNLTVQDLPGMGQILSQSIVLTFGATVNGRVLTTDGTPVPEAVVRLDGHSLPRTVSGNDGTFSLTAVPAGLVAIRAETADRFALSAALQLTAGGQTAIPDLRLDQVRTDVTSPALVKVGLGINWQQGSAGWQVSQVQGGTSAGAAGVQAGDRLVSVNGASMAGGSWEALQNALNGEAGTTVDLVLDRAGQTVRLRLERQVLP